jgi:hypothetical protein
MRNLGHHRSYKQPLRPYTVPPSSVHNNATTEASPELPTAATSPELPTAAAAFGPIF